MEIERYREKLKRYYDDDGRLIQYPSKRPMRMLALIRILESFDRERKYTEPEVNEMIRSAIAFGDIALIRREMVDYKLLERLRDGSQYWVEENWEREYSEYI